MNDPSEDPGNGFHARRLHRHPLSRRGSPGREFEPGQGRFSRLQLRPARQVKLAFGNNDSRFGWTSRGWWTLPAGACQSVLDGEVARGNYYVYTLDGANRGIGVPEAQTGGTFCVKDQNFDLRSSGFMTPQNTIACEAHGVKSVKFRAVEVGDAVATYTYTLVAATPMGVSALLPLIKEAAQNLERPAAIAPGCDAAGPAGLRRADARLAAPGGARGHGLSALSEPVLRSP